MKSRIIAACIALGLYAASVAAAAAGNLVRIVDLDGIAVSDAVIYVAGEYPVAELPTKTAVVDQVDKRFTPRVTAIRSGTRVEFPNSDAVSHHVYSFANPNDFELPLYKGDVRPTILFDHAGLVTLGCNIHDSMLGYIYVVDSPYFAVTDAEGVARIDGLHNLGDDSPLQVWSPDLADGQLLAAFPNGWFDIDAARSAGDGVLQFMVNARFKPADAPGDSALSWDDY